MGEHIDILDLLQLLEDHRVEAVASIVRMAIAEIKRLRHKIEEIEEQHAEPS